MGKFYEYYKTVMEEVEVKPEAVECKGVLIDPDRQSIEPFTFTKAELDEIRSKMSNSTEDALNSIPGAVLLFDDKTLSKDDDFIFSIYDDPEDIPVAGVGYIICKDSCECGINIEAIKPNVRFGSAEELM